MANYGHPANLTLLAIAQPVIDAYMEDLVNFLPVIAALNQSYFDERARLQSNLDKDYTHGSLSIRLRIRKQKHGEFPKAELAWVRASGKANSEAVKKEQNRDFPYTKALHHCGRNGSYTASNIKMILARRAQWEIELTKDYENRLRPLREYLTHMQAVYKALCHHAPPPIIDIGP